MELSTGNWIAVVGLMLTIGGMFAGVVSYFLSAKDAAQQMALDSLSKALADERAERIKAHENESKERVSVETTLFRKHDEDAAALAEVRLDLRGNHYQRPELDTKFDRLDSSLREGFRLLGDKFDSLNKSLVDHMMEGK